MSAGEVHVLQDEPSGNLARICLFCLLGFCRLRGLGLNRTAGEVGEDMSVWGVDGVWGKWFWCLGSWVFIVCLCNVHLL